MAKIAQFLFKLVARVIDYCRGILLFISIILCGGKCKGIPRVAKGVVFKYPPHSGITIGRGCDIGPFCIFDLPSGCITVIGNNVKFTAGVVISSVNNLVIEDDCLFAEWVSIRDAQHEFSADELIRKQGLSSSPIHVEQDVWVGRGSVVLSGAYLEKGCIVGANSLVKKGRLLTNTIYAGIPLKQIGSRD